MHTHPERLHALDAVRAVALLLGIVLHATMSFFLPIPTADVSQSTTLTVLFYVIHMFRMSAFFLIAGFFARMVIERRGVAQFVRDRSKRIVIPMIGGWLVFGTLSIAMVIWGAMRTFGGEIPADVQQTATGFPLTHLWFLYYLCIFYLLALALRAAIGSVAADGGGLLAAVDAGVRRLTASFLAPLVLAAPLAAVLYLDAGWSAWGGIPTPDQGFTPKLPAMVGFGMAFGFGWLVQRQIGLLEIWRRRWAVNLGLAIAMTVVALAVVGVSVDVADTTPSIVATGPAYVRVLYTACYTTAIWCWSFALIGAAMQFCSAPKPLLRYLADSSYWLYLAHLPLVMFLQVAMADLPLHWSIKFPLLLAITMTVLLATYRYWVRYTWIGALLNGRRHPRPGTKSRSDFRARTQPNTTLRIDSEPQS